MRNGKGVEINLSVQSVLNCVGDIAGNCAGGSALGVFEWGERECFDFSCYTHALMYIQSNKVLCCDMDQPPPPNLELNPSELSGHQNYIPFHSCQTYDAQSPTDRCTPIHICCSCVHPNSTCIEVKYYPNITVAEYGTIPTDQQEYAESNIMKVSNSHMHS